MRASSRYRKRWLLAGVPLASLALSGCVTYSQSELARMSAVDICETQEAQGSNLTAETRRAMQDELQRRKTDCGSHAAELAERRQDVWYERVYGSPDDP